jgi:small subunit ribosomal protein S9
MPKKTVKSKKTEKKERYFEAVGRRKTAVARVRIFPESKGSKNDILVNEKDFEKYFPTKKEQKVVTAPFDKLTLTGIKTTVKVGGGGLKAQAEAVRLGASRALISFDPELRPRLKAFGYLTRDPRMVERKKPGLRKARRPQQWRKR